MVRALIVWLLQVSIACFAGELWIAPGGSDLAPGSRSMPMATVQAALVRDPQAHILVEPGSYALERPIVLGPSNSGVVIEAAAPQARPLFEGAVRIAGFQPMASGIWRAQTNRRFEQLWVNGRRAVLARTPNAGWFYGTAPVGYARDPLTQVSADFARRAFQANAADMAPLQALPPADLKEVRVQAWHSWSVSHHRVQALQAAGKNRNTLFLSGTSLWPFFQFDSVQRYHLENYLEALDAPGEWFQARDGWVYYKPRADENMRSAKVMAPTASHFVVISGASNVTLRGLRFHFTAFTLPQTGLAGIQAAAEADAGIVVDDARGVRLQDLEIAHTGQYGVWFRRLLRVGARAQ